jgi:prepilin signal peptidase PulO-like enzyme (type II secretory pathway)
MESIIGAVAYKAILLLVFVAFSIRSVIEDAKSYRVKPLEIAIGIAVVAGMRSAMEVRTWMEVIAGGLVGALAFFSVERLSRGRMGAGDIWYSSFIGFAFGFVAWDISMVVAAFLGLAWITAKTAFNRTECIFNTRIPFTPFMFVGSVAVAIVRGFMSW